MSNIRRTGYLAQWFAALARFKTYGELPYNEGTAIGYLASGGVSLSEVRRRLASINAAFAQVVAEESASETAAKVTAIPTLEQQLRASLEVQSEAEAFGVKTLVTAKGRR